MLGQIEFEACPTCGAVKGAPCKKKGKTAHKDRPFSIIMNGKLRLDPILGYYFLEPDGSKNFDIL